MFQPTDPMLHYDLMTDIETMDVAPTACVVTIGAVLFDPRHIEDFDTLKQRGFYCTVKWEESETKYDRTTSESTKKWWAEQNAEALAAIRDQSDALDLKIALQRLNHYVASSPVRVHRAWAKGPDFDYVILKSAYDAVEERYPIKFWKHRCVRTITDLAFPDGDPPRVHDGVAHNALDDAVAQARMVQVCYRELGLGFEL